MAATIKIVSLRFVRDPVAEAAAAAKKGDFRLDANLGGDEMLLPPKDPTPGVKCSHWNRTLINKSYWQSDTVMPGDDQRRAATLAFFAAYNKRIVSDRGFPYPDICAVNGRTARPNYTGPIHSYPQAARSGDVAKVATLASRGTRDVNERDEFGATALTWAMSRADEPMARALLALGANPELRTVDPRFPREPDGAAPLARAFEERRFALADLMMARGAKMEGGTGLCPFFSLEHRLDCTWAGLLIEAARFDLLDREARAGHLDQPRLSRRALLKREASPRPSPLKVIDIEGNSELEAAFQVAVKNGNNAVALRLAPYIGRYQAPNDIVRALLPQGRADLASIVISTHLDRVARSPSEALIWLAAARAKQGQALAFLVDFGGDLNLLSSTRLQACKRSAEAGDVGALFGCVKAASKTHAKLAALMTRHKDGPFIAALAGAGDLRERDKRTLIMEVAARGTPAMLRALLARGANPGPDGAIVSYGSHPTAEPYTFGGPLAAMAEDWARGSGYADRVQPTVSPLQEAITRGDLEIVRILADADPGDLVWQAERLRDKNQRAIQGDAHSSADVVSTILYNAIDRLKIARPF